MGTRLLLRVGATLGLVLVAVGAFVPAPRHFPPGTAALVNGTPLPTSELTLALARLYGGDTASPEQRAEALHYLIDQELLVQRGVEIGLLESDHTIRKSIATATIDAIVAEVLTQEPSETALRVFYASHLSVFSLPARLRLQQLLCHDASNIENARVCAEHTHEALTQRMEIADVSERFGAALDTSLPDALTPLAVVRRMLGPTLSARVEAMQVGEVSIVPTDAGYAIFRVVDRQDERPQPYETVQSEVRAEYLRRRRDDGLQQALDQWRGEAVLVLSPKAPQLSRLDEGES